MIDKSLPWCDVICLPVVATRGHHTVIAIVCYIEKTGSSAANAKTQLRLHSRTCASVCMFMKTDNKQSNAAAGVHVLHDMVSEVTLLDL